MTIIFCVPQIVSNAEDIFSWDLKKFEIDAVREFRFYEKRKWRFDFAIVEKMIAIEIEGGVWTNGRHTRGKGFTNDCEKYNMATELGWKVFRYTSDQINNGSAIEQITRVLKITD